MFLRGKKVFLGKLQQQFCLGGGAKIRAAGPPGTPRKFPPKILLKNFTQKNLGKCQKKIFGKMSKKNFWKNFKKKILEKFQKKFLGKCPRKFCEKLPQKICWSELGKFFFETFKI